MDLTSELLQDGAPINDGKARASAPHFAAMRRILVSKYSMSADIFGPKPYRPRPKGVISPVSTSNGCGSSWNDVGKVSRLTTVLEMPGW